MPFTVDRSGIAQELPSTVGTTRERRKATRTIVRDINESFHWTGPIEGYVVNFLNKQHWKIARTIPFEDAMQEAYCIFLRCRRKYPEVEEAKHFMALFKTAWFHHFTDLANADTESRKVGQMPIDAETGLEFDPMGETDNDGVLATMIRQAPRDISKVLALFFAAPTEILDIALQAWNPNGDGRAKAGGSAKINAMLGLPLEQDTMKKVVDYFRS